MCILRRVLDEAAEFKSCSGFVVSPSSAWSAFEVTDHMGLLCSGETARCHQRLDQLEKLLIDKGLQNLMLDVNVTKEGGLICISSRRIKATE